MRLGLKNFRNIHIYESSSQFTFTYRRVLISRRKKKRRTSYAFLFRIIILIIRVMDSYDTPRSIETSNHITIEKNNFSSHRLNLVATFEQPLDEHRVLIATAYHLKRY